MCRDWALVIDLPSAGRWLTERPHTLKVAPAVVGIYAGRTVSTSSGRIGSKPGT